MEKHQEKAAGQIASMFIHNTKQHVFLTGKAGTGKTTFLKSIIQHTHKNVIVAAPTGIAAINAGGVTLHSLFHLPFGAFVPDNTYKVGVDVQSKITTPYSLIREMQMNATKRKLLQEMELLVIDEVSMLRSDLVDAIDIILRHVRRQHQTSFGGVQVLFIGDLLQLPPVVKEGEWNILRSYYASVYFFDAQVLKENRPLYIELDKIYRQKDAAFVSILNHLRDNHLNSHDIETLNQYCIPHFEPQTGDGYIQLTTHNHKADSQNKQALQKLPAKSFFFQASIEGEFSELTYPIEKILELKEGAQVMFVKNDTSGKQLYFNGKIGVLSLIKETVIEVTFPDKTSVQVERYAWENKRYSLNESTNEIEENTIGKFIQYPLRLAWAITVHKSQGLTFDKAILDIGSVFAPGQMYVALSRLTSLQGLVLTSPIRNANLYQDKSIRRFSESKETIENLDIIFERESASYFQEFLLTAFNFLPLVSQVQLHVSSYSKDELRSEKQKHFPWAQTVQNELEEAKIVADKFLLQLQKIFHAPTLDYFDLLYGRVASAKRYFEPIFQKFSENLLAHTASLQNEKKAKGYTEELKELDRQFFKQYQSIAKAERLLKAKVDKMEWTKEIIANQEVLETRKTQMQEMVQEPDFGKKKGKRAGAKEKNAKGSIGSSRETSFQLYKDGKSIDEIAQERDMARSTIEGHLSYYVATGDLPIHSFVTETKLQRIREAAVQLDTTLYAPIKHFLGEEYTFSEIRMVMALGAFEGMVK